MQLPYKVVLASASPRRRVILSKILDEFQVVPADIDEEALTLDCPKETACRLALAKARRVFEQHPESLVIGSDTVVALETPNGTIQLAKPADAAEAKQMLRTLSGRMHTVYTAVAAVMPGREIVEVDGADVWFNPFDEESVDAYIATGAPMDKAGAYGYQDESFRLIARIEGDESTIVGLPVPLIRSILARIS